MGKPATLHRRLLPPPPPRPAPPGGGGGAVEARPAYNNTQRLHSPARPRSGQAAPHTQRARGLSSPFAQPYAEPALANSRPHGTRLLPFPMKPRSRHDAWASPLLSTIDFSSLPPPPTPGRRWQRRQRRRRHYQPMPPPPPPSPPLTAGGRRAGGAAEARPTHDNTQGLHSPGPPTLRAGSTAHTTSSWSVLRLRTTICRARSRTLAATRHTPALVPDNTAPKA